jgi:UDP-2-acetamido-2-deoxy-ribo-hexuluronate aminotransferase
MPVSLYGQVADMDEINAIAARHGLAVIEDAAQSFGALYQGRRSCALSTFGATSFFPSKPLGCYGDGGALFTDDDDLAQAAREIRVHGQSGRYHHMCGWASAGAWTRCSARRAGQARALRVGASAARRDR